MNLKLFIDLFQIDANSVVIFSVTEPAGDEKAALSAQFSHYFCAPSPGLSPPQERQERVDAVILLDPLPHSAVAESLLRDAKKWMNTRGQLTAFFPGGIRGYSGAGRDIVLSRSDLQCVDQKNIEEGSLVLAEARSENLSPYGEQRRQRRQAALRLDTQGESLFVSGDLIGALTTFAAASDIWNEDAVIYNNLATVLHALGHLDQAMVRVREALFLDPCLSAARDNFRIIADDLQCAQEAERLLRLFGRD